MIIAHKIAIATASDTAISITLLEVLPDRVQSAKQTLSVGIIITLCMHGARIQYYSRTEEGPTIGGCGLTPIAMLCSHILSAPTFTMVSPPLLIVHTDVKMSKRNVEHDNYTCSDLNWFRLCSFSKVIYSRNINGG